MNLKLLLASILSISLVKDVDADEHNHVVSYRVFFIKIVRNQNEKSHVFIYFIKLFLV